MNIDFSYKIPINETSKMELGYDGRTIDTDERMELQITDTLGYTLEADISSLFKRDIHAVYLKISLFTKIILLLKSKMYFPDNMRWMNSIFMVNNLERFFGKLNIDLIFFTSPSALPKYTYSYNFIYSLWDLSHRDDVEFPEIREEFVFERREEIPLQTG